MEAAVLCAPNNSLTARRMLNGQSDALPGPRGTLPGWGSEEPLS